MFPLSSEKGFSVVALILLAALLFGALNLYAYFNPSFTLSQYTVVALLENLSDRERKQELKTIAEAVEKYYEEHQEYPASNGWCGRVLSILNPDVTNALSPYFQNGGIPQDPKYPGTNKDYFYVREHKDSFALLAVLESSKDSPTYHYDDCTEWPGDNVFNYRVTGSR